MGNEVLAASIGAAIGGTIGLFFGGVTSVPGAAAGSATASAIYAVLGPRIEKKINEIGPEILDSAFLSMGLDLNSADGLNDATITDAINRAFLSNSDLKLASVFDKKKMVKGFQSFGISKLSGELGLVNDGTEASVVASLKDWITEETVIQMGKQSGEIWDAVKERQELKKQLVLVGPVQPWNAPRDLSKAGVANRAYQAKYRKRHSKHWEKKP